MPSREIYDNLRRWVAPHSNYLQTIYDIMHTNDEQNNYDFLIYQEDSILWNVFKEDQLDIELVTDDKVEELLLYLDITDIETFLITFLPFPEYMYCYPHDVWFNKYIDINHILFGLTSPNLIFTLRNNPNLHFNRWIIWALRYDKSDNKDTKNDIHYYYYYNSYSQHLFQDFISRSCVMICSYAAQYNNFQLLKWLKDNHYQCNNETYVNACYTNNIKMIEYILNYTNKNPLSIDYELGIIAAVKEGHLDVVKFLIHKKNSFAHDLTHNFKDRYNILSNSYFPTLESCPLVWKTAVKYNQAHILYWAFENSYNLNYISLAVCCIWNERFDIFKWFRKHNIIHNWNKELFIEYIHKLIFDNDTIYITEHNENLRQLIQWIMLN